MFDRVLEQFEQHPEQWTYGCSARDSKNLACRWDNPRAVKWCFMGMWLNFGFPGELAPQLMFVNDACETPQDAVKALREHGV
jgi:hypothetical protein